MTNPYASPASDAYQHETLLRPRSVQVRWAKPTFGTFVSVALVWGFCSGMVFGVAAFVSSFFGGDCQVGAIWWELKGVAAGAAFIVLAPLAFTMLAIFPVIFFPVFRRAVMAFHGPKLYFDAEGDQCLPFSHLRLRSYVKLSAILGGLMALSSCTVVPVLAGLSGSSVDSITVTGVPVWFSGSARLVWLLVAAPVLYSLYCAVLGLLAFLPFRLVTRVLAGTVLPSQEVVPCEPLRPTLLEGSTQSRP